MSYEVKRQELIRYGENLLQSQYAEAEARRFRMAMAAQNTSNSLNQMMLLDMQMRQQQPSNIQYYGPGRINPDGFGGYYIQQPNSFQRNHVTPDGFGGYYIK